MIILDLCNACKAGSVCEAVSLNAAIDKKQFK